MNLSSVWLAPLIAGAIGAGVLTAAAAVTRREVARLQKAMRPLRVPPAPLPVADHPR
ncbi:MAG TPA: hypothetical protein VG435_19370 [Acidimicrobiales bacterium]|nr:hypothetical protein [Acidimicrobiales bacterium]